MMLRCRRCRKGVAHVTCLSGITDESSAAVCNILHVDIDKLPEWILTSVQQAQWTAGKLNCCNCRARLGGFNFLTRIQCPCGRDATVHLNKSRVDQGHKHSVLIVHPRRTSSETGQSGLGTWVRPEPTRTQITHHHISPAQASNPRTDGENTQKSNSLKDGGTSTSCFCPAGSSKLPAVDSSRSESPGSSPGGQVVAEASSVPVVPGVERSSLQQQLVQTDEDESLIETTPGLPSSLRRSRSDGEAQLEEVFPPPQTSVRSSASISLNKREKNHLKSLRRKQRRRERWLQIHLEKEQAENITGVLLDSKDRDGLTCAVCLDIYFSPYSCQPCGHVFCEPCLRTLAKNRQMNTPCPLCRTLISNTSFSKALDQNVKTFFPKVYVTREQNFLNAPCARWPLPKSHKHCPSFREHQRNEVMLWRLWDVIGGSLTRETPFNILWVDISHICISILYSILVIMFFYFILNYYRLL